MTPDGIELRYATWPRPAQRIPFGAVESVAISTSGRRGRSQHLLVVTRSDSALPRTRWESAAGTAQNVGVAVRWIEHASGGRVRATVNR